MLYLNASKKAINIYVKLYYQKKKKKLLCVRLILIKPKTRTRLSILLMEITKKKTRNI